MKKMLVLSGLFFNASGNQSMEQSIVGYMREYEVYLVTVANMNGSVYKSIESVRERYPDIKVYSVGGTRLLSGLARARAFVKKVVGEKRVAVAINDTVEKKASGGIINSPAGLGTRVFFLLREFILFVMCLLLSTRHKFDAVCAYEINATGPVVWAKRFFRGTPVLFGKFQGTVLGSIRSALNSEENKQLYWMDLRGMAVASQLDACIMTNDGTFGDEVLRLYEVEEKRILFIPNGVALDRTISTKKISKEKVEIVSVSRLTSWKRVHVMIQSIELLRDKFGRTDFAYKIYGVGSSVEEQAIIGLVKSKGLENQVEYCGRLAHSEVPAAFLKADILASIYAHSNVCNPVLEASYLGVPVLTIESRELRSVVGSASGGYFFVEDSDEDIVLAERIAVYLNDLGRDQIESAATYLREQCNAFQSWGERSTKEVAFIQSFS